MFDAVLKALEAHVRAIEALIDRTDALLNGETPDLEKLAKLRWEQIRALREYQLFKQFQIFAPAIPEGGTIAQLARRLETDCGAAGEAFRAHVMRWNGCVPGSDWPAYRYAARSMMDRVRRHLNAERNAIGMLLRMRRETASRQSPLDINRSNAR